MATPTELGYTNSPFTNQYQLQVFETATGKLVWEYIFDNLEDAQNDMEAWDQSEYEFNLEQLQYEDA